MADALYGCGVVAAGLSALSPPRSKLPTAHCGRALATGALWTNVRTADVGYLVPTVCARCGQPEGTVHHRFWAPPRLRPGKRMMRPAGPRHG